MPLSIRSSSRPQDFQKEKNYSSTQSANSKVQDAADEVLGPEHVEELTPQSPVKGSITSPVLEEVEKVKEVVRQYPLREVALESTFTKVSVEGPFTVVVQQGETSSVQISAEEAVIEALGVEVQEKTVKIAPQGAFWTKEPIRVYVTSPNLLSIQAKNKARVEIPEVFHVPSVSFSLSDRSELEAKKLQAEFVSLSLKEASKAILAGEVSDYRLRSDYTRCKLDDRKLKCDSYSTCFSFTSSFHSFS